MAVPMAVASLVGTLVGGGVSAYGAYAGGQRQQQMFDYQSRVAQINASIAGQQANVEQVTGDIRAQQSGLKTAQRMGLTRAGIAAGGLDTGSGSAKAVLGSEAEVGQFEQSSILNDATRRALAYSTSQFGDTAQAGADIAAGQGAVQAADINVGTSILGAATSVSDKWTKFGEVGLTPPTAPQQTSTIFG